MALLNKLVQVNTFTSEYNQLWRAVAKVAAVVKVEARKSYLVSHSVYLGVGPNENCQLGMLVISAHSAPIFILTLPISTKLMCGCTKLSF